MSMYQVLGVKGETVEINGVEYDAREALIELSDEDAAEPLAQSKIALVEDVAAPAEEEVPAEEVVEEETPVEEEEVTTDEEVPAEEEA